MIRVRGHQGFVLLDAERLAFDEPAELQYHAPSTASLPARRHKLGGSTPIESCRRRVPAGSGNGNALQAIVLGVARLS